MTGLPPPSPSSPDEGNGWAAPTPGTAGQFAGSEASRPVHAEPDVEPDDALPRRRGRREVVEAHMAARRVPARWEELRDQRERGERPPARRLALVGVAVSLLALVAGGVLLARGAGGVESRIAARVPVGTERVVELRAGEYDIVVEGRGLFRSGGGGQVARRDLVPTVAVAFDPPALRITGPAGDVSLVAASGERGGHGDRQRALVYRAEIVDGREYVVTVGEWNELSPRINAVLIGQSPLLRQPNVWSGVVMLAIGFAGIVITLASMSFGALASRVRRRRTD